MAREFSLGLMVGSMKEITLKIKNTGQVPSVGQTVGDMLESGSTGSSMGGELSQHITGNKEMGSGASDEDSDGSMKMNNNLLGREHK